ncbi:MAG TPA: hypothetical protein VI876_03765, partial [Dehalococcoidia bacterium]|nr:hypothetical protein [Dehalococcoidia bacterium]
MPRRLFLVFVLAVVVCGLSAMDRQERAAVVAPAGFDGVSMLDQPIEKQARDAGAVVIANVTDIRAAHAGSSIETTVSLDVESYIKGAGPDRLTLKLPGGSVGELHVVVGGVPNFLVGERVLLLLDGTSNPKLLSLWQSKYSLAGARAYQPTERPSVAIKDLEGKLSKALSKTVTIPFNEDENVIVSAFYVSCPAWPTASLPLPFEVNPAIPGGSHASTTPPSGMNFSQIAYESWHAWQALANSYAAFSYVGTTSRTGLVVDGLNTVSWGDIATGGVLGVNQCAWSGSSRVDSDTVIDSANFSWDWDNSIAGGSFSLRSVMEHELGHGLSMGHTCSTNSGDANYDPNCGTICNGSPSTPLMCPAVSAGSRKVILADDQAGAASIYTLSGAAPGAPPTVNVTPGSGSNTVNWTAASGSKFAYDVERGLSGCSSGWTSVGSVSGSSTSFVDNHFGGGLPAGTYCYRVKALGVGGDSAWTTETPPVPVYGVTWGAHTTPGTMPASGISTVAVSFTNTGSLTWPAGGANPVRLAYHWKSGACPGGSNVVWNGTRAALPGDVATSQSVSALNIAVTAPASAGSYCLVYDMVREGVTWFSTQAASTLNVGVTVTQALPTYGVTWNSDTTATTMTSGSTNSATVNFSNAGSLTWQSGGGNPVRLSYHWRSGACPGGGYTVWDGPRATLAGNVATGQTANLTIGVIAPAVSGTYCLVYDLVREGMTWFSTQGASTRQVQVNVQAPVYGVNWGSDSTPLSMGAGAVSPVSISFTNTGSLTWQMSPPNPVRLSYHWRSGACPGSATVVWDGPRSTLPSNISPGGTVTALNINVTAPPTAGSYCLVYDLVREGITWFSTQGGNVRRVDVNVGEPVYAVTFDSDTTPSTMLADSANDVDVTFTNVGTLTWASGGGNSVRLSYHWRNGACTGTSSAIWDNPRAFL